MQKSVKLNEVRRAYAKTGLKPARGSFCNDCTACALGALYCELNPIDRSSPKSGYIIEDYFKRRLGKYYVEGFISGFDGDSKENVEIESKEIRHKEQRSNMIRGYKDGLRIGKAIFNF